MVKTISALLLSCLCFKQALAQPNSKSKHPLETNFKAPPVSARPRALWPWVNGNVSLSQITYELEQAKAKGMGGFDIWDVGVSVDPEKVVPPGPPFLGDESVQAIAHAIREADRLGLELGLTISSSWNAGGSWVKPEHAAMGLFRADTIVEGGNELIVEIGFPRISYTGDSSIMPVNRLTKLPAYYKQVAILAHRYQQDSLIANISEVVRLDEPANPSGKISWNVPPGKWRIVRYVCAPTGQPLAIPSTNSKGLMLDHFSAEAQRANLNYIFNRILPVTGSLKNRSLKYLYADSYEVNSAVWTPKLPEEFSRRAGYSIISYLPVLDGFRLTNTDSSARFLFDFRKTLSDLIIDNHYVLGRKLCEEQGIGFCAEAGGPGKPIHNVPFEDLKALGALTIPRGEFWNKHPQLELLQIIKGIASASHIYNQTYVEAESFTSVWLWQEGPNELKPLADRAMCEGLNRFIYHTFPHTPPASGNPGWVYNFGTLINTTNGWWPKSTGFHQYLARCSYMLQQGHFVGDVAFYYGDDAPNFVPPKHIIPSLGFGYDYDVLNTEILLTKLSVRDHKLYLPHGQSYQVLVLPPGNQMNLMVARRLLKLVTEGATVIGDRPKFTYTLLSSDKDERELATIVTTLWGTNQSPTGERATGKGKMIWGKPVREVLLQKAVRPDVEVIGDSTPAIDFIHRIYQGNEIYFIRNTLPEATTKLISFRTGDKPAEFWDPNTGDIHPVTHFRTKDGRTEVLLPFEGYGSYLLVFRNTGNKPKGFHGATEVKENLQLVRGKLIHASTVRTAQQDQSILTQPWLLYFEQPSLAPPLDTMSTLSSLSGSTKAGVRYHSGLVTYKTSFQIDSLPKTHEVLMLELGEVREIAEVFLNGVSVGTVWHHPFSLEITTHLKKGNNFLEIEVVNSPNNRLIGESMLRPDAKLVQSNITRLPNAWMKPFKEATLLPSGIIGPVRIVQHRVLTPE